MSSLSCILRSSRPSSLSFTCEAALALPPPAVESRVGGREPPPGLIPRWLEEEGEPPRRMTRGGDIELMLRRLLLALPPPRDGVEARGGACCWVVP